VIAADYGTANGEPFFCTFGVGFDAAVSERFARQKRRGLMMYLKSVIDEYVSFSPERYVIEVNGQTISDRAFLVVVCNASQYGNNAFIAPDASVTDGELDITVVHTGNIFQNAVLGVDFLTGYLGKNALIDTFRASNLRITRTSHGAAHIDGDPALMSSEISIECHPGKLKLFSPTRQTSFRPVITPVSLFFRDMALAAAHLLPFHKR
jgi:diacylglycerol kinase family enzyme